ncbi:MAG: PIN domain-containing protein [Candidatus Poribacteria bacterium]|nr:PIN domain-containing protein [Candidatus Poribacteria bacterium]
MPTETLYLFSDTNLFIQCKSLNELDWSEWANFSEIHLIVCRPVLREIDNQKNYGNSRVSRRARKAHSLFRDIAINEKDYELIQKDGPKVKLFLEPLIGPCSELSDRLDYSKPDDEIVGCLCTYVKQNPEADVRLLTHDSGPMMTTRGLGLSFIPVKEDWILPPENNEANREITRLKNEIAQLKKAEPEFHIQCLDSNDIEVDSLEIEYPVYEPLSERDISAFMDLLKNRFPPAKIFGPREPETGVLPEPLRLWKEAISRYKDQEYPFWIKKCEDFLSKLHEKRPSFFFFTENRGTRPGNNALIDIASKGNFKICSLEKKETRLHLPPKPPQEELILNGFRYPESATRSLPPFFDGRDPNGFYYKSERWETPVESFCLECEQWRHGTGALHFGEEIFIDPNINKISGALECVIHAENLSNPVKKVVPVKITVAKRDSRDYADTLVNDLLCSTK